jgi:hypothetical protein
VRAIPAIVPAALIVLLLWWITLRGETWVAMRTGQINAWLIARFGWADMSWLFIAIHYAALWIRWVVATMLALSLIAGFVAAGARSVAQLAWVTRAMRPRALLFATLWFGLLIALPWKYLVPWRPAALPATSVELVFIAGKLSLAAILFAMAVALMIKEAGAEAPPSQAPSSPPPAPAVA